MSSQLTQAPGSRSSNTLVLIFESFSERVDSFSLNNSHSHGLIKCGDVSKSNYSRQGFSFGLRDKINKGNSTSRVADKLGKIDILLCNFPYANGSILSD
jgi:hypothetical protein